MADTTLTAASRTPDGSRVAGRLRREGNVPAVVYGLDEPALAVSVPARELSHILAGESGANTVITLELDGSRFLTLARQIQRDPLKGTLLHVDFIRVRADEAVSAEVPLQLLGEAVGVRDGGLLDQQLFHLTVSALPADIPVAIEADVSGLGLGDQILVGQLPLPAGVTTDADPDALVAMVAVPRGLAAAGGPEGEGEGEGASEAAGDGGGDGSGDGGE